jgi:hypothetical protein
MKMDINNYIEEIMDCQIGCQFQFDEFNNLVDMDGAPCDKSQCSIAYNNPTLIHGYDEVNEQEKKEMLTLLTHYSKLV